MIKELLVDFLGFSWYIKLSLILQCIVLVVLILLFIAQIKFIIRDHSQSRLAGG